MADNKIHRQIFRFLLEERYIPNILSLRVLIRNWRHSNQNISGHFFKQIKITFLVQKPYCFGNFVLHCSCKYSLDISYNLRIVPKCLARLDNEHYHLILEVTYKLVRKIKLNRLVIRTNLIFGIHIRLKIDTATSIVDKKVENLVTNIDIVILTLTSSYGTE